MPPVKYNSIIALEDNSTEMFMCCTEVLLRIAKNILKEPDNPKYRSISLGSNIVTNKLLPASGALQCLFEMGFEEGSDKLILPAGSSLDCVKYFHDELLRRRELRNNPKPEKPKMEIPSIDPVLASIKKEVSACILPKNNEFLKRFIDNIVHIWGCESVPVQLKALKCVPLPDLNKNVERVIRKIQLAIKKKEVDDQIIDSQELLLLELCKWFKSDFFSWVNTPECSACGDKNTKLIEKTEGTSKGVSLVEVYKCSTCNENVLFPRHHDAEKLLETRRGRCGEWARCFYLICRSIGWDARYVIDETDHVWVEVYSLLKKRWIHCDPCETVIDAPLIYECGWKKNLSYIIAYSKDEIQDVTWRYSSNFSKILRNRGKCTEEQLVDVICNVRKILLNFASETRREFVTKRAVLELVDLMVQKSATEAEKQGRSSGSLAWRLARGEITLPTEFKPFVWKPEVDVKANRKFIVSYCTTSDEYVVEGSEKVIKGWKNGLYELNSVFRKEEQDWKVAYLAREEGSEKGSLTWRFETESGWIIGDIQVTLVTQTYENGKVQCKLCDDKTCVIVPKDESTFTTSDFKGSTNVELSVELTGGKGDVAWQHAQILRQPFKNFEKTFKIAVDLNRV